MPKTPPTIQIQVIRDQIIAANKLSAEVKNSLDALETILYDLTDRVNELIESVFTKKEDPT